MQQNERNNYEKSIKAAEDTVSKGQDKNAIDIEKTPLKSESTDISKLNYEMDEKNGTFMSKTKEIAAEGGLQSLENQAAQLRPMKKDGFVDFESESFEKFNRIKPISFNYFGDKTKVSLWQPLYLEVCKKLAEDYPLVFLTHRGMAITGDKPEIGVITETRQMRQPRSILRMKNGEWLFVETYLRADGILTRIKVLLNWCAVDYENLEIEYEVPKQSVSEPFRIHNEQNNNRKANEQRNLQLVNQEKLESMEETCTGESEKTRILSKEKCLMENQVIDSGYGVIDFNNIPDLTFIKPVSMELFGQEYKVRLWKEVYVLTIKSLYPFYSKKIDAIVGNPKNGTGVYLETEGNAKQMYSPKQVVESTNGEMLFVETNRNTASIVNSLKKFLAFCGCSCNQLKVYYPKAKENNGVTTNETGHVVDFDVITDLSFTRPISMELLGQEYKIRLWKDVYVLTIRELYRIYAAKFDAITGNPKNGTGLYIDVATNAYRMRSPKQVARSTYGKTLFVETNKNATSIAESLKKILDLCECGYNLLTIRYEKTSVDEVPLPEKHCAQSVQKWENYAAQKKEMQQSTTSPITTEDVSINSVMSEAKEKTIQNQLVNTAEKKNIELKSEEKLSEKQQQYAELLKEEFPDGFRESSVIASKKMLIAYQNKYGVEPSESKEEVMKIVQQVGTLRDGRIYAKTQSQLLTEISGEVLQLLNAGATCVFLDAVFERYHEKLAEEQHIYNAEALREPLISISHGQYVIKWGMFCLPDRDADISLDVLLYMRKHPAPVTYDELQEELWYIPLDKIKKALMDDPAMVNVGDGTYFYAPNLPVSKEELHLLSSYMESELGYHSYATTKQLMQLIHEKCPTIEINTEGFSTLAVRNSLSYLLRKEFNFRGNIISLATTQPPVDTKQAFCEFCRERETMTTDELQAFADEVDSVIYWDSVFSEMVRVSEHDWVRKDQIRWTPEAIDAKLDEMCEGDYLIIKDICLFLQFPVVDYRWNGFLLESYVNAYSPNYMLLHTSFSVYDCCGAIVKKTSSIHDYHDLAVDVLAKDTNWNDQQSALQVLVDKGLQQRKKLADIAQVVKEARLKREKRQKEST
ncbi:MAG: hypothetical protein PUH02_02010 [bacterium]|nr:hypothetical protein [bacterium]